MHTFIFTVTIHRTCILIYIHTNILHSIIYFKIDTYIYNYRQPHLQYTFVLKYTHLYAYIQLQLQYTFILKFELTHIPINNHTYNICNLQHTCNICNLQHTYNICNLQQTYKTFNIQLKLHTICTFVTIHTIAWDAGLLPPFNFRLLTEIKEDEDSDNTV